VPRGEALEAILQNVVVGLRADINGLKCIRRFVDLGFIYEAAANEIWSRLSNGILQRSRDGESSANAQAKTQNTAVQLP
jgi:hypothetical protein